MHVNIGSCNIDTFKQTISSISVFKRNNMKNKGNNEREQEIGEE